MIYLSILIILLFLSSFFDNTEECYINEKKRFFIFTCLILILLSGLRENVGGDTVGYAYNYKLYPEISKLSAYDIKVWGYQPGWVICMSLFKSFTHSFVYFQFVHALFINLIIFHFIYYNSKNIFLVIILYFIINYFEYNMEILRESISISFGLISYNYLVKKKFIQGFIFIIFAFFFHISAIVLLLYPIAVLIFYSKRSNYLFFFCLISIPLIYISLPNLFKIISLIFVIEDKKIVQYAIQNVDNSLNINFFIRQSLVAFIIPFFCLKLISTKKKIIYGGFIYIYMILKTLAIFSIAFNRFSNYFSPFFWILLSDSIWYVYKMILFNKKSINKFSFLALSTSIILLLYQIPQIDYNYSTKSYYYQRYLPYKSFIFSSKKY
jgi:hypothetical protein